MSGFAAAVVDETATTHSGNSTLRRTNTMQLGADASSHRRRKGKKKKNRGRLSQHGGSTRRKRKHKHRRDRQVVRRASGATAGAGLMGTIAEEEEQAGRLTFLSLRSSSLAFII